MIFLQAFFCVSSVKAAINKIIKEKACWKLIYQALYLIAIYY